MSRFDLERFRAAPWLLPPVQGGEVGWGVRFPGAPASRRHRAKRGKEGAGGTPAHPGDSPMSGIGKIPARVAKPVAPHPTSPLCGNPKGIDRAGPAS